MNSHELKTSSEHICTGEIHKHPMSPRSRDIILPLFTCTKHIRYVSLQHPVPPLQVLVVRERVGVAEGPRGVPDQAQHLALLHAGRLALKLGHLRLELLPESPVSLLQQGKV